MVFVHHAPLDKLLATIEEGDVCISETPSLDVLYNEFVNRYPVKEDALEDPFDAWSRQMGNIVLAAMSLAQTKVLTRHYGKVGVVYAIAGPGVPETIEKLAAGLWEPYDVYALGVTKIRVAYDGDKLFLHCPIPKVALKSS
ncbi:hypothetical protein HY639_03585 [Candidatus Woesearchaeota archaeon]|nr:hypothetical protein [Candidatus Woesearchaeota archaeon]